MAIRPVRVRTFTLSINQRWWESPGGVDLCRCILEKFVVLPKHLETLEVRIFRQAKKGAFRLASDYWRQWGVDGERIGFIMNVEVYLSEVSEYTRRPLYAEIWYDEP
jgi:hypothetical protein